MSADLTEFSAAQKVCLLKLLPEYEKYISEKNPDHHPHCKELSGWQKEKAKEIMKEPLFQKLVQEENVEMAAWEMVYC